MTIHRKKVSAPTRNAKPKRNLKARVVIICEGKKTEPNYINQLIRNKLRLGPAVDVEFVHCGTAPITLVDKANEILTSEDKENPINALFCVFDKDHHESYDGAVERLEKIKNSYEKKKKIVKAITSVPCFELWLYLHIKMYAKPVQGKGKKSSGQVMLSELKELSEFANYEKGEKISSNILNLVDNAVSNAEKLAVDMEKCQSDNPSTRMHELYEYLKAQQ